MVVALWTICETIIGTRTRMEIPARHIGTARGSRPAHFIESDDIGIDDGMLEDIEAPSPICIDPIPPLLLFWVHPTTERVNAAAPTRTIRMRRIQTSSLLKKNQSDGWMLWPTYTRWGIMSNTPLGIQCIVDFDDVTRIAGVL
jgi:hypothetical protein